MLTSQITGALRPFCRKNANHPMDERHPLLSTLAADPPRSPTVAPDRPDILPGTARLKLLEAAMDQVHESLLLFDRDGWIRFASAEASRATGYSPEELLSMRLSLRLVREQGFGFD